MFLKNIAKYISNYQYNQASIGTIGVAKAAFLDFFGVAYRGVNEISSQIAISSISQVFQGRVDLDSNASIIGMKNRKIDILNAGLINGISAHNLELDDGHRGAQIHLGAVVFPTALAISEANNLSGKEFLEAVVVGYELGILFGKMVNPNHRNKGFHSTGTIGTLVAGAVASKLLKLDEEEITNALGLCGTQAAGLLESDHRGTMGKPLHAGKAVYNGMLSAILAKNGFTGAETILEGREGFLNAMVNTTPSLRKSDYALKNSFKELGKVRFRDIYFKKYPFCRHVHSAIDTALKLRASIGDEYDHIESVTVKTYALAADHSNFKPKNIDELKQSLPYAIAITLVCGEIDVDTLNRLVQYGLLESYSNVDKIKSIKNLVEKITILVDDQLNELYPDKRPSNLIIQLDDAFRNGVFQNITLIPKGDFENPFELKELINKFKNLNPTYDINNLVIIDNVEDHYMKEVVKILNG